LPPNTKITVYLHGRKNHQVTLLLDMPCSDLFTIACALYGQPPRDMVQMRVRGSLHFLPDSNELIGLFGIEDQAEIEYTIKQPGGGKRGRAAAGFEVGGGRGQDKDSLLATMRTEIGTSMLVLQQSTSRELLDTRDRILQMTQEIDRYRGTVFTRFLQTLSLPTIQELHGNLSETPSTKVDSRYALISKELFRGSLVQLALLRQQISTSEQLMKEMTKLVLLSDYADDSGNMSWKKLTTDIMAVSTQKAARAGAEAVVEAQAAAAAAAPAAMG
jgi:hypothetical protein